MEKVQNNREFKRKHLSRSYRNDDNEENHFGNQMLRRELNEAQETIVRLQAALKVASDELASIKKSASISATQVYDARWTWVNKIVFVLRALDRPLSSPEIIHYMLPHEPLLQRSRHRPQALSGHLNKLCVMSAC